MALAWAGLLRLGRRGRVGVSARERTRRRGCERGGTGAGGDGADGDGREKEREREKGTSGPYVRGLGARIVDAELGAKIHGAELAAMSASMAPTWPRARHQQRWRRAKGPDFEILPLGA